jgi:hypothetical protein
MHKIHMMVIGRGHVTAIAAKEWWPGPFLDEEDHTVPINLALLAGTQFGG